MNQSDLLDWLQALPESARPASRAALNALRLVGELDHDGLSVNGVATTGDGGLRLRYEQGGQGVEWELCPDGMNVKVQRRADDPALYLELFEDELETGLLAPSPPPSRR